MPCPPTALLPSPLRPLGLSTAPPQAPAPCGQLGVDTSQVGSPNPHQAAGHGGDHPPCLPWRSALPWRSPATPPPALCSCAGDVRLVRRQLRAGPEVKRSDGPVLGPRRGDPGRRSPGRARWQPPSPSDQESRALPSNLGPRPTPSPRVAPGSCPPGPPFTSFLRETKAWPGQAPCSSRPVPGS